MEAIFQSLVELNDYFLSLERKSRTYDYLSNVDQGLASSKDLPWDVLKHLNSCLPLNGKIKICEDAVRENIIALYQKLLSRLLNAIQHDTINESWKKDVFEGLFTRGCHSEAFVVLCLALQSTGPSVKLDIILSILEKFVAGHSFTELFFDQCYYASNKSNSITKNVPNPLWDQLISYLVSLPDRVANKLKGKTKLPFDKTSYVTLSSNAILSVLGLACEEITHSRNTSLEFLSQLVGRLCLSGYGETIFNLITPKLLLNCKSNFVWRKVSSRLIVGVPDRCLEIVLKPLLNNIPWFGYVKYFLGEKLTKPTLKFLIMKKFVLIRHFEDPTILRNCIGYLAIDEIQEGHILFLELVKYILESWCDGTSLRYLSYEQHLNWSAALAMSAGYLKNIDFQSYKQDFLKLTMDGVHLHINNTFEPIRIQGMFIGTLIISILDPDGPKLQFDFEQTEEVKKLLRFTQIPEEPHEDPEISVSAANSSPKINSPADIFSTLQLSNTNGNKINTQEIDSDDDLEAYDQSDDVKTTHAKVPFYVRDCLQGLIDHSDTNWTHMCLEYAEKLIRSQNTATKEIATELAKVLLHLDNNFAMDNFVPLRFKAMVAVLVNSPEEVSKFLTTEFYERNYSIRQRLDILEVLAATSQELSGIRNISAKPLENNEETSRDISIDSQQSMNWKEVVKRRIEGKTRIITKGRTVHPLVEMDNQFSKNAGCFFFPLLINYDRKQNSFNLLGDDSYLLGRLIYTLGIFINSASNSMVVRKLAKSLLEFLWIFRYHVEVFVRQSLLFSLSMVILNVPPSLLISEMESELFEYQSWLQDVTMQDPDLGCRKLASQVLSLMVKTIKEVI